MNCLRKPIVCGFASALILFTATASFAAAPKINRLSVRGLQAGATTRIGVTGTDLANSPRLVLDAPIKSQKVVGTPQSNRIVIEVTLDKAAAPGVHSLRIATPAGVTAPEIIAIDDLPQVVLDPADKPHEKLPIALHGTVTGAAAQETKFVGRRGDKIVVDVLARRFGSKLRPVVHVFDSKHREVAWSLPTTELGGDARTAFTVPADDTYTVAVHDLAFAAPNLAFYRVAIGSFDFVDAVYPPVVGANGSSSVELVGHFGEQPVLQPPATAVAAALNDKSAAALGIYRVLPWSSTLPRVGLRPSIERSDLNELTEEKIGNERRLPDVPCAVSGRLALPGETDVYKLNVAAGDKLRIDVFADRLGSPLDAALEIRNDQGGSLMKADDAVGADPRVDYDVPKEMKEIAIAVSDVHRRGDERSIYRVVITRLDAKTMPADFRLTVADDTHSIPAEGSKVFRVEAERTNYDGPIRLSVEGLPRGFTAPAVEIPANALGTLVEIRNTGEGTEPAAPSRLTIRGESVGLKPALVRNVELAAHPLATLQPWLKYDVVVAASDVAQPLSVAWDDDSASAASSEPPLYIGVENELPLRVKHDAGAVGPVRFTLVTSQPPPIVNRQANAAMTIRAAAATNEMPVEKNLLAAAQALEKAEAALTAAEKAAKPEAIKTAEAGRNAAAKKVAELEKKTDDRFVYDVIAPADLKTISFDLALKAELLSLDGKTVVAETYSRPRRFAAVVPLDVVADAVPKSPVDLDPKAGATIALTGSVKRLMGYANDVVVTVVDLPAGITAPTVTLKPKTDQYRLDLRIPPSFKGDELAGIKLRATINPDNRRVNADAKLDVPLPTISLRKKN